MRPNRFPKGWNEERVREVLEHYENQTEEEAVAEAEAALSDPNCAVMAIPHELVPAVQRLIVRYEAKRKASPGNGKKKPPVKKRSAS